MRTLLLSSLSILGGLTTVHAQHWVPYSFHAYKQNPQKTKTQAEAPAAEQPAIEQSVAAEQTVAAGQSVAAEQPAAVEQTAMEKMADEGIASNAEFEAFIYTDGETANQTDVIYQKDPGSVYYSDPDRDYGKPNTPSKCNKPKPPRQPHICTESWWVEGDFLLAWMKKGHIEEPLITTGSAADPFPGAIGQPGTHVVFGNKHYNYHRTAGVKASIGSYLGPDKNFSFDIDGFWIFSRTKHFNISSNPGEDPLIARPFYDVRTASERAELVSSNSDTTGFFSGSSRALIKTQFWGAELNIGFHPCETQAVGCHTCGEVIAREKRPCEKNITGGIFVGFRYLRLFEKLKIKDEMDPFAIPSGLSFNGPANVVNMPDSLKDEDVFRTNNDFFGGQIGIKGEYAFNCWMSLSLYGKAAFGVTEQKYKSEGSTTWESSMFGNQYAVGGVLVQPNNMVHEKKWKYAWVPEAGINFSVEPFSHLRFLVGYSFLWWSKVVRPGEQINRKVNSGQIPGNVAFFSPAMQKPNDHLEEISFWMQTVNFGISFDF